MCIPGEGVHSWSEDVHYWVYNQNFYGGQRWWGVIKESSQKHLKIGSG